MFGFPKCFLLLSMSLCLSALACHPRSMTSGLSESSSSSSSNGEVSCEINGERGHSEEECRRLAKKAKPETGSSPSVSREEALRSEDCIVIIDGKTQKANQEKDCIALRKKAMAAFVLPQATGSGARSVPRSSSTPSSSSSNSSSNTTSSSSSSSSGSTGSGGSTQNCEYEKTVNGQKVKVVGTTQEECDEIRARRQGQ